MTPSFPPYLTHFQRLKPGKRFLPLALLALLVILPGCQKQAARQEKPVPLVTVEEVKLSDAAYPLQTTGMVEPWQEAKLSFQVPGKIAGGPVEEGLMVTAGAELARLDSSDYRAQADTARYQLDLAEVELDRAGADLERSEKLFASGAIPQKALDDARYAFRAASAKAGQAASALRQAGLMVEHSALTAPFSGKVLKKLCHRGEMVAAGTPVLVLGQLDPVKVTVTVPASQVDNWAEGSGAWVAAGGITSATTDGGGQKLKAVVHRVSPGAEGLTGAFRVDLKVDNPGQALRPGQVVNVSRQVKTRAGLWVPLKSVVSRGQELKYVFVLGSDGKSVALRPVKLGPVAGDRVEIVSGLESGSRVVVLMPEDLRDGDRVEVKPDGSH